MLQLKQLPKVVRVGAAWPGTSRVSTVHVKRDSLLILKGWKRRVTSRARAMKAYDLNTKEKEELPEECRGTVQVKLKFPFNFVSIPIHYNTYL